MDTRIGLESTRRETKSQGCPLPVDRRSIGKEKKQLATGKPSKRRSWFVNRRSLDEKTHLRQDHGTLVTRCIASHPSLSLERNSRNSKESILQGILRNSKESLLYPIFVHFLISSRIRNIGTPKEPPRKAQIRELKLESCKGVRSSGETGRPRDPCV